MASFKPVEEALTLYVSMFMGAPMAAFVPLLVAIFGVGSGAIVATVFIFSVFIILVNTQAGVRSAPKTLLEMSRSFGAPPTARLLRIVLPSAMPLLLTGVRVGFSRAVSGLILGEMLVVVVGFGGLIMQTGSSFRVDQLWVLIFIVLSFALLGSQLLEYVQRRVTAWASSQDGSGT
jgi:NitT/TauT family transport system permease protein